MMVREIGLNKKIGRLVFLYLWVTYFIYLGLTTIKEDPGDLQEWRTFVFLLFASVAFYQGCRSQKIIITNFGLVGYNRINNNLLGIFFIALISISLFYLQELVSAGVASLSFNLGQNYAERLEADILANSIWGRLSTLSLPFRMIIITYCILNFKYIRKYNKILFVLFLMILILDGLFRGIQVGLGNIIVYIMVPLYFLMHREERLKRFRKVLLFVLFFFIFFFFINQLSRATAYNVELNEKYLNNTIIKYFGNHIGGGLLSFLSYFSHGYRGLNYSLQLPFEWTYGYGGSRALNEYLHQYLNFESMYNFTYPMRVKAVFGYDCEMSWPTAFSWWASDLSFPGVVILMFFIGKLVCKVINDAFNSNSIYPISFLSQLVILIIFMPLNNQAFQARDSFIATVFLFFLWLIKRKIIGKMI